MKKIEKLKWNDKTDLSYADQILNKINEIIDVVNNQCKDCGYIAPLKEVWDTPEENEAWKHLENKPFKVKIVKCSNPDFWHHNKIGQIFDVINTTNEPFYYFVTNYSVKYLFKQDCEIVEDEIYYCKDCDTEINKGEFDTFGICNDCWDKHCHQKKEKPDWQKAVKKANKFNWSYDSDSILKLKKLYIYAISLMQTEIENLMWQVNFPPHHPVYHSSTISYTEANEVSKLKQQLTENSAHSAGVINNLEAENKQLKQSQIKIDDDSIEWLESLSKGYYYHTEYHKQKADYILKQIRG